MHSGKGLASVFQESSASIGEAFILVGVGGGLGAGRWAAILWGLDTFLIFPSFLGFKVFSRSVFREATCIYHVCK